MVKGRVLIDVRDDEDVKSLHHRGIVSEVLENSRELKRTERFRKEAEVLQAELQVFYSLERIASGYGNIGESIQLPQYTLARRIMQEFLYRDDMKDFFENRENALLGLIHSFYSLGRICDLGLATGIIEHHVEEGHLVYEESLTLRLER